MTINPSSPQELLTSGIGSQQNQWIPSLLPARQFKTGLMEGYILQWIVHHFFYNVNSVHIIIFLCGNCATGKYSFVWLACHSSDVDVYQGPFIMYSRRWGVGCCHKSFSPHSLRLSSLWTPTLHCHMSGATLDLMLAQHFWSKCLGNHWVNFV